MKMTIPSKMLKADIAGAKGRTILTETTGGGMGRGAGFGSDKLITNRNDWALTLPTFSGAFGAIPA